MNRYQQNARGNPQGSPGRASQGGRGQPRHRAPGAGGHCTICSYKQEEHLQKIPVYHRHFSSLNLRELTGVETTSAPYLCPSCKAQHQPYPLQETWSGQDRVKIVLSDSTLHSFFAPPSQTAQLYSGDRIHVDYVTIPGADITTIANAFRLDYVEKPQRRPLDVAIVAGYNDLIAGNSRNYIMEQLSNLTDLVKLAGLRLRTEPNTVAVSTLMYPPKLAWFTDNGPVPYPGYVNHIDKIDWLNREIHELNLSNGVDNYVGLHTYGVRKDSKIFTDRYGQQHTRSERRHRYEHWRESVRGNMLHLRDDRRFKMGIAINNYFIHNT